MSVPRRQRPSPAIQSGMYDRQTGELIWAYEGGYFQQTSARFAPDGRWWALIGRNSMGPDGKVVIVMDRDEVARTFLLNELVGYPDRLRKWGSSWTPAEQPRRWLERSELRGFELRLETAHAERYTIDLRGGLIVSGAPRTDPPPDLNRSRFSTRVMLAVIAALLAGGAARWRRGRWPDLVGWLALVGAGACLIALTP